MTKRFYIICLFAFAFNLTFVSAEETTVLEGEETVEVVAAEPEHQVTETKKSGRECANRCHHSHNNCRMRLRGHRSCDRRLLKCLKKCIKEAKAQSKRKTEQKKQAEKAE